MGDNAWVWWIAAAVVLLVVLGYLVWSARRRVAARTEAGRLREHAAADEPSIGVREGSARETQVEAERARGDADRLQTRADHAREHAEDLEARAQGATAAARDARDEQTDELLQADDVDPDSKR